MPLSSSSCSVCGSKQTNVVDGLMYCDICGTQIFTYCELEADDDGIVVPRARIAKHKTINLPSPSNEKSDEAAPDLSTPRAPKKRKMSFIHFLGEILKSNIEGYMEHDDLDVPSEILNDVTSGRSHVPSYLGRIGIRISTFTKILAKGVVMILKDGDVPSVFPDHVFSLYQRYLSACNVAYTSNDYTDDLEKMFRALLVNKKLSQKREKGKKRKKEMRKMKAKEVLEKSVTAWDLLMSSTLDENLELHSDEEQQEVEDSKKASTSRSHIEPQLVEVVNTTIPKEILNHAMSCYLALDVLVALLFISLVTIGCKWILLSDIVRWVREGRSQISVFQLSALRTGKLEEAMTAKSWWTNMVLCSELC
ncbi:hypothetical protein DICVIV_01417 [Dictyocaulus viviparus]|uniref:Uncharacterized protein n=1 Tax=Dictyocaulus viviparus TaxID=29172 RepID=A0A0D8Y6T3_DICVI|nr:hypothetical protein DICVIV_01417 [Dictyocaulus viviparus]